MKNVVKFLLLFVILGVVIRSGYIIIRNNQNIEGKSLYSDVKNDKKVELLPIRQVRDEAENVIQDLKDGKYEKLTAQNPFVYITKEDVLYQIIEKSNTSFRDKSLLELLETELAVMKQLIGEDLDMFRVTDNTSSVEFTDESQGIDIHYVPTYEETVESIKNGTYQPNDFYKEYDIIFPFLIYGGASTGSDDKGRYCCVPADLDCIIFWKGRVEGESKMEDEEPLIVKQYYRNSPDLADEYQLYNGSISVGEAIAFTENYFANLYPFNMFPESRELVHHVEVLKQQDGKYIFRLSLTKEYAGLIADTELFNKWGNTAEYRTSTRVYMKETDDINIREGTGNAMEMQKDGKEIREIIGLNDVLKKVSASIGKNSSYEVKEISMIFRRDVKESTTYKVHHVGIPNWMIRCENATDEVPVTFYINMENGALSYVQN